MKLYRQQEWKAYCAEQLELHGDQCAHCLRSGDEVVLQVHHRHYVKIRKPWEYPYNECEVLCRGCHAREHGVIVPSKDWHFVGEDDLGGQDGKCDYCGTALRYTHMVTHPNWGTMIVGAQCCNQLTQTTIGSEAHADFLNHVSRRKAFIASPKWVIAPSGVRCIVRAGISIEIVPTQERHYRVRLDGLMGKIDHLTLLDAQLSVFDTIESGKAAAYLAKRRRKLAERGAVEPSITRPIIAGSNVRKTCRARNYVAPALSRGPAFAWARGVVK